MTPTQTPPARDFLRTKDIAEMLGVSAVTIWRWRRSGDFPEPHQLGVNTVGWPRAVVEDWLASRAPTTA